MGEKVSSLPERSPKDDDRFVVGELASKRRFHDLAYRSTGVHVLVAERARDEFLRRVQVDENAFGIEMFAAASDRHDCGDVLQVADEVDENRRKSFRHLAGESRGEFVDAGVDLN